MALFYGRLLSIAAKTAPTMTTTIMMAIMPGSKYWSAAEGGAVVPGEDVAATASTAKVPSPVEGQYPFVPAKLAITLYLPVMSGVHW